MAAGATYEPIATTTLGTAASSITFSSIPSTYTDLRLVMVGNASTALAAKIQFNGDTNSNYSDTMLYANGSTTGAANYSSANYLLASQAGGFNSGSLPSMLTMDIFLYSNNGSVYKTSLINFSNDQNGSGTAELSVGLWRSTAAITSVFITTLTAATFSSGTIATLYGIKAA